MMVGLISKVFSLFFSLQIIAFKGKDDVITSIRHDNDDNETHLESLQIVNKHIWHPQVVDEVQINWLELIFL